jgi:hypothetical protein
MLKVHEESGKYYEEREEEAREEEKKRKRKEEKRKRRGRTARPLGLLRSPRKLADILGKIRIHSIHRSRRFPKSMERDGWEIRG